MIFILKLREVYNFFPHVFWIFFFPESIIMKILFLKQSSAGFKQGFPGLEEGSGFVQNIGGSLPHGLPSTSSLGESSSAWSNQGSVMCLESILSYSAPIEIVVAVGVTSLWRLVSGTSYLCILRDFDALTDFGTLIQRVKWEVVFISDLNSGHKQKESIIWWTFCIFEII